MLGKNYSRRHIEILLLFFQESRFWHFVQTALYFYGHQLYWLVALAIIEKCCHGNCRYAMTVPLRWASHCSWASILFLFFAENMVWDSMQNVPIGDNLHEMSSHIFLARVRKSCRISEIFTRLLKHRNDYIQVAQFENISRYMRTGKTQISLHSRAVWSGLHCPLTESLNTTEYMNEVKAQMILCICAG